MAVYRVDQIYLTNAMVFVLLIIFHLFKKKTLRYDENVFEHFFYFWICEFKIVLCIEKSKKNNFLNLFLCKLLVLVVVVNIDPSIVYTFFNSAKTRIKLYVYC